MFGLIGKKNMTIKYLGEQWLADKKMTVKPSTYANYSRLLNDHIIPALGNLKYESLDKSDINKYISKLAESGRKRRKRRSVGKHDKRYYQGSASNRKVCSA